MLYYQCLTLTAWLNFESRVRRFLHQLFSPVWTLDNIDSLPQIEAFEAPFLVETPIEMANFTPQTRPKSDTTATVSELEISLTNYPDLPRSDDEKQDSFSALRALKGTWSTSRDNAERRQRGNFLVSRATSTSNINNNNNQYRKTWISQYSSRARTSKSALKRKSLAVRSHSLRLNALYIK